ncbi:MAG: hypothetical protein OXD43_13110, partial [Bacteroidetes bacterium]|nr:hypothetical protein [Bacteroidota bacterium]
MCSDEKAHIIHYKFPQGDNVRLWLCGVRISGVSRNLRVRLPDWGYKRDDFRIFSGLVEVDSRLP